jgi:hypothetical protein
MDDRVILVVADHDDHGARAAARAAASRLPTRGRVLVATGADLAAARWSHHVDTDGRASTRIVLPGGGVMDSDCLGAVLARCPVLPSPPGLWGAPEPERTYASAELTALVVSWLASLGGRVVNAVDGGNPCGPTWTAAGWERAADAVSFPSVRGPVTRNVLVAGHRVLGAGDETEADRARSLATYAGCRLLQIGLTPDHEVSDVTCLPSLLDASHVDAVAALLLDLARGRQEVAA